MTTIAELRQDIDQLNLQILRLLSQRAALVEQIGRLKDAQGLDKFDPQREKQMLAALEAANDGPFRDETVRRLFKEIFAASMNLMETQEQHQLQVSRQYRAQDTVVRVGKLTIGGAKPPVLIAGPCSIESHEQLSTIAHKLAASGVRLLRAGAFKPRTSPYSFQGLGVKGLSILEQVAKQYGLATVTEVLAPDDSEEVAAHADMLQVGTRNMYNTPLLKRLSQISKPVLLKRGFMASLEEFILAAEYLYQGGNRNVVLCERGIRTFEHWTRNTLDISAIPILKQQTHLPVIVDISHAAGRKDIVVPLAKACLAAGADGLMVEVHDCPTVALSDGPQQLSLAEFDELLSAIGPRDE